MAHLLEPAATGRSKCRGCGRGIERGALRFGQRIANPYGHGAATLWFQPLRAAYKRPEAVLEPLASVAGDVPDRAALEAAARTSASQRRRPRIDGVERAPSGQAKCRCCREAIAKGTWRIRIVYYEDGRFTPGGSVHLACRRTHFETDDVLAQALHFSPDLGPEERAELERECARVPTSPAPSAPPAEPHG
jgi:hypothetical protein